MSYATRALFGIAGALLLAGCAASPAAPSAGDGANPASGASSATALSTETAASAGAQGAVDQCSYLSTAEIETATGLEVAGIEPDPSQISRCFWRLSGEGNQIGLSVYPDDPRAIKEQEFNCTVGFGLDPLEGLGDSACADFITGGEYNLHVLRGDDRVTLRGGVFDKDNQPVDESVWTTLAEAVLAKLP